MLGVALAEERFGFATCNLTVVKRRGLPGAGSGCEAETVRGARQKAAGDFNPCSEPTDNFFFWGEQ